MKYVYPAVFTKDKDSDNILVDFPDLEGCFTDGADLNEAFDYAEDALNLTLWSMEKNGEKIPAASVAEKIKVPEGGTLALIRADTTAYARQNDKRAVRKNVSIPSWMNTMAKERNLNLSNLLQNAIREALRGTHTPIPE